MANCLQRHIFFVFLKSPKKAWIIMNNKNSKVKNHSICQLEGWDWKGETITVEDDGMTAYRCYKLTQKPLKDLSPEDIRFLIGQQCGLPYLVPMALEILEKDFFIETEYYKGDLVADLLQIKDDNKYDYWPSHTEEKEKFCEMYMKNQQNMEEALDVSVSRHIIKKIRKLFDKFCEQ
ncbi:MAG: hypothetical protein IKP54_05350 [Bacteroidales bacterium]|nr:hypothetical protein [Bacteroidales bacterium]